MTLAQISAAAIGCITEARNSMVEAAPRQAFRVLTQAEINAVAGGPETTVGTGTQPP